MWDRNCPRHHWGNRLNMGVKLRWFCITSHLVPGAESVVYASNGSSECFLLWIIEKKIVFID